MKAPILRKEALAPGISRMVVSAPAVAAHAAAGQFVILRPAEDAERIPLTISSFDPEAGTVTIVYQTVGATTMLLDRLSVGDSLPTFTSPLGRPSHLSGLKSATVIGGGLGCAIALPTAEALHRQGCRVTAIAGFRSREQVILQEEMAAASSRFLLCSDDGTAGEQGFVTGALERLLLHPGLLTAQCCPKRPYKGDTMNREGRPWRSAAEPDRERRETVEELTAQGVRRAAQLMQAAKDYFDGALDDAAFARIVGNAGMDTGAESLE